MKCKERQKWFGKVNKKCIIHGMPPPGTADGRAVMRAELDFHSTGDINPAFSLCTFGRGPGARPCSVTQVSNSGRVEGIWKASVQGGSQASSAFCVGTQLLPGNQRCFLSKMQRWDLMGHLIFFWVINQLRSHWCCLATKSALAPGSPHLPSAGPQGTRPPGWVGMVCKGQRRDPGQLPASAESLGAYLAPL